MPIAVVCQSCSLRTNVPDAAAGKKVKCPKCSTWIRVPAPTTATPAAPPVPEPLPIPVSRPPMDLEDDNGLGDMDDDDRPSRGRPNRKTAKPPSDREVVVGIIKVVVWGCCILWTGLWSLLFVAGLSKADNAIQEASLGAVLCFPVIAGYVVCRAVDSGLAVFGGRRDKS